MPGLDNMPKLDPMPKPNSATSLNRRSFLDTLGTFSMTALVASLTQPAWSRDLHKALSKAQDKDPAELAGDEEFWIRIRQSFTVSPNLINLNNGGVSPAPKIVQDAMKGYLDTCNEAPSYYMWRVLDRGREPLRKQLAALAGCSPEEIAIDRNTSEALETIVQGLSLKAGDEIVLCKQDYPNMINAWKQRALKDGIKLVWVDLELPSEDNEYLAGQYIRAFTPKTKLVQITHVINWNGQILPVRQIADAAHRQGIDVMVDGAHSFAQFQFTIPELGSDYFGTSLHKWLTACIGSGMLYVKKEKIRNLYPLFAAPDPNIDDIRKFEHLGTRPIFIEQAIGTAIEFHNSIGAARKEQRLFYLKNYWMNQVADLPNVKLHTSLKPGFACAIGMVSINGRSPQDLEKFLLNNYKIHTVAIDWENIHGLRVTPNVYTTTKNLDLLVKGITEFARS
jgi:selenocysteine lyase/cysteine desulfurase